MDHQKCDNMDLALHIWRYRSLPGNMYGWRRNTYRPMVPRRGMGVL